jgi:hypothetical protein
VGCTTSASQRHHIDGVDVLWTTILDGAQASIVGQATINGSGNFRYRIDVKDLGEGGSTDTYRIQVFAPTLYDSGEQTLLGGYVQSHK